MLTSNTPLLLPLYHNLSSPIWSPLKVISQSFSYLLKSKFHPCSVHSSAMDLCWNKARLKISGNKASKLSFHAIHPSKTWSFFHSSLFFFELFFTSSHMSLIDLYKLAPYGSVTTFVILLSSSSYLAPTISYINPLYPPFNSIHSSSVYQATYCQDKIKGICLIFHFEHGFIYLKPILTLNG